MRSILLQLHIGTPVQCESWQNAPVAHGTQITVYVDSAGGWPERLARRCHAMLEREIAALGALRAPAPCTTDYGRIFDAHTCAGAVTGLAGRILIFVADGSAHMDPIMLSYFSNPGSHVIPIVDMSQGQDPRPVLPLKFRTILAERTTSFDPTPLLPRIVRGVGLLSQAPSVFISYRHEDAAHVAGQLFHALAAKGYTPFLDRFCGQPGDDFVDLISEELAGKACLLSLETTKIGASLYCRQEVATAVARHMGMIALDLPGSLRTFPAIAKRIDATVSTLTTGGELNGAEVARIVAEFEAHFPHEAARRPRWQDTYLHQALLMSGVSFGAEGLGRYSVRTGSSEILFAMSPSLPDTEQFIEIEEMRDRSGTTRTATVFGPVSAARTNRFRKIAWLSSRSMIKALDEGELLRYLGSI